MKILNVYLTQIKKDQQGLHLKIVMGWSLSVCRTELQAGSGKERKKFGLNLSIHPDKLPDNPGFLDVFLIIN